MTSAAGLTLCHEVAADGGERASRARGFELRDSGAGSFLRLNGFIVTSTVYGHKSDVASLAPSFALDRVLNLMDVVGARHDTGGSSSPFGLAELVDLYLQAKRVVVFTGAGISTESGIPDYRGPGGVWERNAPPTLGDFRTSPDIRRQYWSERRERYPTLRATLPNSGHQALARLQAAGRLDLVITQNIDGLHQKAGSDPERIVELHGTAHQVRCLDCGASWDAEPIQKRLASEDVPACEVCGGILRAATVLFGEAMPEAPLRRAFSVSRDCDLILVVGSSLVVQPAARVPEIAVASGADLAIVNAEPTPLDHLAAVVVRGKAGSVLATLADAVLLSS